MKTDLAAHKNCFELHWISRTKAIFWWYFYLWLPFKCLANACLRDDEFSWSSLHIRVSTTSSWGAAPTLFLASMENMIPVSWCPSRMHCLMHCIYFHLAICHHFWQDLDCITQLLITLSFPIVHLHQREWSQCTGTAPWCTQQCTLHGHIRRNNRLIWSLGLGNLGLTQLA